MRFSYEYKIKYVDTYRSGVYPKTPESISDNRFRSKVRKWNRIEKSFGPEGLKPKNYNRSWTPEEKLLLVSQVLAGKSYLEVAISNEIKYSYYKQNETS